MIKIPKIECRKHSLLIHTLTFEKNSFKQDLSGELVETVVNNGA